MKELYKLELIHIGNNRHKLSIGFGEPAQNSEIVPYVVEHLEMLELGGARLLLINGPASLPVACAIAHKTGHLYGAVAVWDPKLPFNSEITGCYVVAISHDPEYKVGMTLTEDPIIV